MAANFGTGPHHCNVHNDFETDDVNKWNKHCRDTGHTEEGECICAGGCGKTVPFKGIPYQDITTTGKNIQLKCEDCFNKGQDMNAMLYAGNKGKTSKANKNVEVSAK